MEKWPSGVNEVLSRDPLIITGPDLPRGQVNDSMCEMVDITPTILELLGVKERYPHSGVSLVSTMKSKPSYSSEELMPANSSDHKPYAFTEGGFLKREEPWTERGMFPYDKKGEIQHVTPVAVGRAVRLCGRPGADN